MKTALVFGAGGQGGHYLTKLLLDNRYHVVGVLRRASLPNDTRLADQKKSPHFEVVEGDVTDAHSVRNLMRKYKPDEVYNLAAQSHVHTSFEQPAYTWAVNAEGVLHILEALREYVPGAHFVQASTSEMFGNNYDIGPNGTRFQSELTTFSPASPYAVSKVAAHYLVANYRRSYGLHASCAIMFNYESPYRGDNFVTKKIINFVKQRKVDPTATIRLGNIDAYRDWSFAGDTMNGVWKMAKAAEPNDYVLSRGVSVSVRYFIERAFVKAGLGWGSWEDAIVIDPQFKRPEDVQYLCGKNDKAKQSLNWQPTVDLDGLIELMLNA